MLCLICLFAMQPFWSEYIVYGNIFLTRDARAFDKIVMSLFLSDIDLQFAKPSLIPFLYRSIIRAKYCEYVNWLLSNPLINIY